MQKKPKGAVEKVDERDEFLDAIGERIKIARVRAKLTQKELAALLSTNQSWIFMVEDGQQNLQLSSLRRVAQTLKVSVRDLIPEDIEPISTYEISPEISETLHKLVSQMTNAILKTLADMGKSSVASDDEPRDPKKPTQ